MHRGVSYITLKRRVENKLREIFLKRFPHLQDSIDFVETGSPITYDTYLGTVEGSIYGTYKNGRFGPSSLESSTVFVSGQDVFCSGIAGALLGGIICAARVSWKCVRDLMHLL